MLKQFRHFTFLSVPAVLAGGAAGVAPAMPSLLRATMVSAAEAVPAETASAVAPANQLKELSAATSDGGTPVGTTEGAATGEASTSPAIPVITPLPLTDPRSISAQEVAAEVDRQILAELARAGIQAAELCNDEDFLRRASLDIAGQLPSPADVHAFRSESDPAKRAALIERLLASPEFGLNWGRYWRDVIYFRATEQRSRLNQEEFTTWMAAQWNNSVGWNATVTSMLTAKGNVLEHPETALIFAQGAHTEDVAAEACRVFLGIQLQCANCHDHPTDIWKREQFHQLAAYFPRIAERRVTKGKPEFEIASVNTENRRAELIRDYPDLFVRQFDRNNDDKLSREELEKGPKRVSKKLAAALQARAAELKADSGVEMDAESMQSESMEAAPKEKRKGAKKKAAQMANAAMARDQMAQDKMDAGAMKKAGLAAPKLNAKQIDRLFEVGDTNKDGDLTIDEIKASQPPQNKRRGATEHHMSNLLNPESEGELIDPKFFIDGSSLPHGQTDEERRKAVAEAFVSPNNPWFARAIVNRVWAEMLGEGFYMPIDDLGPARTPRYPEVLDLLCVNFVKNDYDPKWLVRTIANTATYQRKIRSKSVSETELPFASATPVPLRSDIIFNSLAQVFSLTDDEMGGRSAKAAKDKPRSYAQSPRFQFDALFGSDPSVPKEDVTGTIPQSLMMMNSRVFRAGMSAKGGTRLAKILKEHRDNTAALKELYLVTLSREPSEEELRICTQYIADVKARPEAFEDLMWSLLNSSEFISRR